MGSLRVLVLGLAVGLAGCLEPRATPCGEMFCIGDTRCVADTHCGTNAQIVACSGVADGEVCTADGVVGRCDLGVCMASGCGNSVIESGEVCDDGNVEGGDGCSADCKKVEACGDALADQGEDCDDGNANPVDGCDACTATQWVSRAVIGADASNATMLGMDVEGVAVDLHGNLFIADKVNHRVRKIDTAGIATTIAGNGSDGSNGLLGDGGPATSASVRAPSRVAVDGLGNVYILGSARVRRVDPDGVITTVVGTGNGGGSGNGGPATAATISHYASGLAIDGAGNLYIADYESHCIRRVDLAGVIDAFAGVCSTTGGFSGDGGAATVATLASPSDVAVAADGTVYIADSYNYRVRKVATTGIITTFAGTGGTGTTGDGGAATSAQIGFPVAVTVDAAGNVYSGDGSFPKIRKIASSGIISTFAGVGAAGFSGDGGPAIAAGLQAPTDLATNSAGDLFIAEENDRLRRVQAGTITSVAGTGSTATIVDGGLATSAQLANPTSVTYASGAYYIADQTRVRRVDSAGLITTIAGSGTSGDAGDGGPATSAHLMSVSDTAVDAAGNVYIADRLGHRVRKVSTNGTITAFAGTGTSGATGDGGAATSASLNLPAGLAIAPSGVVYIADSGNHRIRKVDTNGVITTYAGTGTAGATGDNGPATSAQLRTPSGIRLDGNGNLFVADRLNHRVRRIATTGVITTVAGSGVAGADGDGGQATAAQLAAPEDVSLDSAGNLYIADTENLRIRRVATNGVITTFAGTGPQPEGFPRFGGDGGQASDAVVGFTPSVDVDGAGNVLLVDSEVRFVRRVATNGVITSVAGAIDPEGTTILARARLSNPRQAVWTAPFLLVADGTSGTVQALRTAASGLEVVAGRYPQEAPTGSLARFQNSNVGTIGGVAPDLAGGRMFITESNRISVVTLVDVADAATWTIAPLTGPAVDGFVDGGLASARFRGPTSLFYDATKQRLLVADTGNHVIRAIALGTGAPTVSTIVGTPATLGYFGEGIAATSALLYRPEAMTVCGNGDIFVADTANHRVRRIASDGTITTVLGDGSPSSSGEGKPSSSFPVDQPRGLACDALGNLYVTSSESVRLLAANDQGVVDGTGVVLTIYGAPPRDAFPASVTACLSGIDVTGPTTVQVVDSCSGLLVELERQPVP